MNHSTRKLLLLVAIVAMAACPCVLRADAVADLGIALNELNKKPAEQDAKLIDTKLASAAASPGNLNVGQYVQARTIQAQRRVAALADKTAPEKRLLLNDDYEALVAEIGRLYLPNVAMSPGDRFGAYRQQLEVVGRITVSVQARGLAKGIVKAILSDIDTRYLADTDAKPEQKENVIDQVRGLIGSIRDGALRSEFEMGLWARMIALETPRGKRARFDRARRYIGTGNLEAAGKDFEAIVGDIEAPEDLKRLARFERMNALTGRRLWSEALPDADVLGAVSLKDVPAGGLFGSNVALDAKRRALRVQFVNGELDSDQFRQATDALWLEVLVAKGFPAERKSEFITEIAKDRARSLGTRHQWAQALGWAKLGYNVAPNRYVPELVTLIQQILANKSRKPFTAEGMTVAKNPADLAAAEAFYFRQSGRKQIPGENGAKATTVVLKPDLSNTTAFPRELDDVALPLTDEFKTSIQQVATGHDDPLTRALACGLLGNADKAIVAMGQAVDTQEMESPNIGWYVNFMARFVRARFESVALANAFLESQVHGSDGKDGQPGTADDKPNPLAVKE